MAQDEASEAEALEWSEATIGDADGPTAEWTTEHIMYGVPPGLPLEQFVGTTLEMVAIGQFQLQFAFSNQANIGVEGRWELRDRAGIVIDAYMPHPERDCYRVHRLIGQTVASYTLQSQASFTLSFATGGTLVIYGASDEYESFSIQPGDVFV